MLLTLINACNPILTLKFLSSMNGQPRLFSMNPRAFAHERLCQAKHVKKFTGSGLPPVITTFGWEGLLRYAQQTKARGAQKSIRFLAQRSADASVASRPSLLHGEFYHLKELLEAEASKPSRTACFDVSSWNLLVRLANFEVFSRIPLVAFGNFEASSPH